MMPPSASCSHSSRPAPIGPSKQAHGLAPVPIPPLPQRPPPTVHRRRPLAAQMGRDRAVLIEPADPPARCIPRRAYTHLPSPLTVRFPTPPGTDSSAKRRIREPAQPGLSARTAGPRVLGVLRELRCHTVCGAVAHDGVPAGG
ncbi:hypothetical protein ANO14919_131070 [Xylariales sp. No.14919]|nr:hypothetical protein ANO14919_131070 [Xylariales sp. No.14919]